VTAHNPDPHKKTTLYYGWYSNRTRGYRKRHGLSGKAETADPVPNTDDRVPLEVRRSWARLIRQVYECKRRNVAKYINLLQDCSPGAVTLLSSRDPAS
jgi:hypothetical protein